MQADRERRGRAFRIVCADEFVEVVQRKAAPWRAQNAEPCTRSCGLSTARARASASRTSGRSFNCSRSRARKGMEASRSAAQWAQGALRARPRTAMRNLLSAGAGLLDAGKVAGDQRNNFRGLGLMRSFRVLQRPLLVADGGRSRRLAPADAGNEVQVQREARGWLEARLAGRLGRRKSYSAAVVYRKYFNKNLV